MRISLYVANYHAGNPSDYLKTAFESLGHEVSIVAGEESEPEATSDFHLLVDSGSPFSVSTVEKLAAQPKTAMWCIDFRHNKDRAERVPNDWQVVKLLAEHGHCVFQAQYEDAQECIEQGIKNCHWLPLAADTSVWNDSPALSSNYDLCFIGNVFDQTRARVIGSLLHMNGIRFAFGGPTPQRKGYWLGDAAKILRSSKVGFNINSFFGEPYCFDINMRFYETLSTGTPLITNWVAALERIFPELPPFIKVYRDEAEIISVVREAMNDHEFLSSGSSARAYVLEGQTYTDRAKQILETSK